MERGFGRPVKIPIRNLVARKTTLLKLNRRPQGGRDFVLKMVQANENGDISLKEAEWQ
jgi:hypothetical protein